MPLVVSKEAHTAKHEMWDKYGKMDWFAGCTYSLRDGEGEIVLLVKKDYLEKAGRRFLGSIRRCENGIKVRVETVPPEVYQWWIEEWEEEDRLRNGE